MKPDYRNWVPKGLIVGVLAATVVSLALFVCLGVSDAWVQGGLRLGLGLVFGLASVALLLMSAWCVVARRAFSYEGPRQLSRQIVEGVAAYVELPQGGTCLDVGCGSAALTVAVAKRNPHAKVLGLDYWGKEYEFSKELCESNARAEGVTNVSFIAGNAVKLAFPAESFDAVTSNYVYHNIKGTDHRALLLETLRVLKKGGCFAIHDLMRRSCYRGDFEAFRQQLLDMGFERVEVIDTTDGMFMSRREASVLQLGDSRLLVGRK